MTTTTLSIAVFEGDGIGPEIMGPTLDLLSALSQDARDYRLHFTTVPAGAAHYRDTGVDLSETGLEDAQRADAILLSAMGLPSVRYPDGTEIAPQITLRKALGLFAGVRPVRALPHLCPLRLPEGKSIDFVLIRESTEGLFYSQGKGECSADEARETLRITRAVTEPLCAFAFDLAAQRQPAAGARSGVTCVDKANVFRAFAYFRSLFDVEARRHPHIPHHHAYVDAMALWLVQRPWDFDVLVTENMFGDILSDLGAGLMGGLGVAPSADIGAHHAVFQPCHGSAPDIAGSGVANPTAMLLSAGMMLDWLGTKHGIAELNRDAKRVQLAVDAVLGDPDCLTRDLGGRATTRAVADSVADALRGTVAA
ncbi:MAG: isocitrate/isopropylmalate family dehydrogenase [Pseudomonadota bacterium]